MSIWKELLLSYPSWKEQNIDCRYFPPSQVDQLIQQNGYSFDIIGKSFLQKPIYNLRIGKGKKKVLLWAQMHGNESTASRAMFDIFKLLHLPQYAYFSQELLSHITIDFIPQLNPDGAELYTRRNAMQIDINRDFHQEATPEMQCLKNYFDTNVYNCVFNLHDQRSIFNVTNVTKPATISFLSPVISDKAEMTPYRKYAMDCISSMVDILHKFTDVTSAKFSDAYYPHATGDNFQKLVPTILIECGHYPHDYHRNETRKYTALALLSGLYHIAKGSVHKNAMASYNAIPLNDHKALDIIYRNISIQNDDKSFCTDLGIQYEEVLINGEIHFLAKIHEVGDLSDFFGHEEYHAENRLFKNNSDHVPHIGKSADFTLGDWIIENGLKK